MSPESLPWPDRWPTSGPVLLRPFAEGDLGLIEELAGDPYVPLIGTIPVPYSEAAGLAYIQRQHQRLTDGTGWSFAVAELATGRAVGGAGLWLHDGRAPTAGYSIAGSERRRGFAAAALQALTAFAWTLPAVERVELLIEPENVGSWRTAERCGYVREALLPAETEIGGRWRDMYRYARTRVAASRPCTL